MEVNLPNEYIFALGRADLCWGRADLCWGRADLCWGRPDLCWGRAAMSRERMIMVIVQDQSSFHKVNSRLSLWGIWMLN